MICSAIHFVKYHFYNFWKIQIKDGCRQTTSIRLPDSLLSNVYALYVVG